MEYRISENTIHIMSIQSHRGYLCHICHSLIRYSHVHLQLYTIILHNTSLRSKLLIVDQYILSSDERKLVTVYGGS